MRIFGDSLRTQDMRTILCKHVGACGALFVHFWRLDVLNQGLNVKFIPVIAGVQ